MLVFSLTHYSKKVYTKDMNHLIGKNGLLDQNLILKKAQIGESDKIADLGCGMHGYFVFPASLIVG